MSTEKTREDFEKWLLDEHGLESEWQPRRNCFKDFPAHLAFKAWQASRDPERYCFWRGSAIALAFFTFVMLLGALADRITQ